MSYPKIINWLYEPKKREYIEVYYVEDEATEKAIKELGKIPRARCSEIPGIKKERITGLSSSSKNYGRLYLEWQEKYPELEHKYITHSMLSKGLEFNGFIYTNLSWLDQNELDKNEIIEKKLSVNKSPYTFNKYVFIKKELFFDKEFINSLLTYEPRKNGWIAYEWSSTILPEFLQSLKIRSKDVYKELLKYDRVKELDLTLACQLGEMRVKDLNKGYVKLDAYFFCGAKYTSYWDGEHIKVVFKDFKKYEYMLIKPTDDVYVTVVDENTLKFD